MFVVVGRSKFSFQIADDPRRDSLHLKTSRYVDLLAAVEGSSLPVSVTYVPSLVDAGPITTIPDQSVVADKAQKAITATTVAMFARGLGVPFFLISSREVFGGYEAAKATDEPNPFSVDGTVLWWAEQACLAAYDRTTIIRVSDLYGVERPHTFPYQVAAASARKGPPTPLPVKGLVTPAYDQLAAAVIRGAISIPVSGITCAHVAPYEEPTSWFEFCRNIGFVSKTNVDLRWVPANSGLVASNGWGLGNYYRGLAQFMRDWNVASCEHQWATAFGSTLCKKCGTRGVSPADH